MLVLPSKLSWDGTSKAFVGQNGLIMDNTGPKQLEKTNLCVVTEVNRKYGDRYNLWAQRQRGIMVIDTSHLGEQQGRVKFSNI